MTPAVSSMRRAAALVAAGLLIQLIAAIQWTPGTFVLSALLGIPLVIAGAFVFIRAVLRLMKDKGAL